eukprot:scaffold77655_cov64-Phaeocystis_antarctica.AAC.4
MADYDDACQFRVGVLVHHGQHHLVKDAEKGQRGCRSCEVVCVLMARERRVFPVKPSARFLPVQLVRRGGVARK